MFQVTWRTVCCTSDFHQKIVSIASFIIKMPSSVFCSCFCEEFYNWYDHYSLNCIVKVLIESVTAFYWSYLKSNFKIKGQQTSSITFHAQNLMLNMENYLAIIFFGFWNSDREDWCKQQENMHGLAKLPFWIQIVFLHSLTQ